MIREPLISIILPTYNGSEYLEQAIKSCLEQSYYNFELIIVDDASTDETSKIINRYLKTDDRVRSIRHKKNSKLPSALNSGFSLANGSYLTWTSDDNCYRPQAITEMVAFLETHQKVDIVYSDYTMIFEKNRQEKLVSVEKPETLWNGNCIGACFLYRNTVQEKLIGYAEDLNLVEDYDFWLRASACFKFQPLHKDLYIYRSHQNSLTESYKERILYLTNQAIERNLPNLHWMSKTMHAKLHLRLAKTAHGQSNKSKERQHLIQVLRYSPNVLRHNDRWDLAAAFIGKKGVQYLYPIYGFLCRLISSKAKLIN